MNDNELIAAIGTQIEAATANSGWAYEALQKDQPTQQGVPIAPTVFLQKMFDDHFGPQSSSNTYDAANRRFIAAEVQIVVTHFQISALVTQNPDDLSIPTASDVVNQVKLYLQHRETLKELRAAGIKGIQVKKVDNQPFVNDKERFEFHPTFGLEVQHERRIERTAPAVTSAVGKPSPIPDDNRVGLFPVPDSPGETFP
jgi:hypothetical protein